MLPKPTTRRGGPLARRRPAFLGARPAGVVQPVRPDLVRAPNLVDLPAGAGARELLQAQGLEWTIDVDAPGTPTNNTEHAAQRSVASGSPPARSTTRASPSPGCGSRVQWTADQQRARLPRRRRPAARPLPRCRALPLSPLGMAGDLSSARRPCAAG